MKKSIITRLPIFTFCALMAIANTAQSAIVNFTLSGQIDLANIDNPFGVAFGDTITASGTYDDSVVSLTGDSTVDFSTSFNNMVINIGNTTYTDAMDIYGGAYLYFTGAAFTDLDYQSITNTKVFSSSSLPGYAINGGKPDNAGTNGIILSTYIEASWDTTSFTVTAVPIPAALWLFGSGLIFLAGFTRKNSQ